MKLSLPDFLKFAGREPELRARMAGHHLLSNIKLAEKFVFDTGQDRDRDTTEAIRETAIAMAEQNLLHLPYPKTWIEDPYEGSPDPMHRRLYYCEEKDDKIVIFVLEDYGKMFGDIGRFAFYDVPIVIDLAESRARGKVHGTTYWPVETGMPPQFMRTLIGEVLYAVQKFLVVLATKGTETERTQRANRGSSRADDPKNWPFTVVRVPLDRSAPRETWTGTGHGTPPRKHHVRGYQWGKNTRPIPEQKWIWPYWRGHEDRGVIEHVAHVVR